jgi:ABC-type transport system involved in cytochrome bd biosynthesis fused ATPase/permease subunit
LDEATSALDPDSEKAIGRTLQKLRGELTIIAISHQSALVKLADRAYRLEDAAAILVTDKTGNSPANVDKEALGDLVPSFQETTKNNRP